MGLLPYDLANGISADGDNLQACLVELETNIQNINVAANAAISSSKLDLSLVSQNMALTNTKKITFKDSGGSDSSHITQTAADHLEVKIGKVSKTLSVLNSASSEVASIDTSNSTFNAWNGFKLQAWASGNGRAAQMENDGAVSIFGSTAGDVALDPESKVVRGLVTNDIDLGSATYEFKGTYTTTLSVSGAATVDSLTDGTASLSSGALSGATTGAFSGAVSVGSLSSSGSVSGTTATFTGLLHVNGNFFRVTNNSDVFDIDCDGTDVVMNASAGVGVIKGNKAFSGNGAYINHSDKRLKKNIKKAKAGLAEILKLNSVTFERKGDANRGTEGGFLADEVERVLPHAVYTHGDGIKGIAMDNLFPVFVNAIKELNAKIEA